MKPEENYNTSMMRAAITHKANPPQLQSQYGQYSPAMVESKSARDEFITEHRKNGLFERLYNGIKNLTGLGTGSKKAKLAVERAEKGEISEDDAKKVIKKYRNSQANSAQIAGDAVSIGVSMFGISKLGGFLKDVQQYTEKSPIAFLKQVHHIIKPAKKPSGINRLKGEDLNQFSHSKLVEYFKHPTKKTIFLALGFAATTGLAKTLFGLVNRIGSHEFQTDKKDFNGAVNPYDKAAYAQVKKYNRKERNKSEWKNFFSGALNAALLPVTGILGGIVGVPLYFILNTLNRHFVGNHEDNKDFKGYFDNLKNDSVLSAGLALGMGIPAFIKTHKMSAIKKPSMMAVQELQRIKAFRHPEYYNMDDSSLEEVTKIILGNEKVAKIIAQSERTGLTNEKLREIAQELSNENFFAAKFKQISNDGSALTRILREDLDPTRTYGEAQAYIDKVFGKGKYIINKDHYCLGVGTVAETYFAKDKNGKEVCIKALKEGINEEKLANNAEAFKQMIAESGRSPAEITQLQKNVDNLYEGVLKEINLENEKTAAEKLAKSTKFANVVKGIEVKDNVYVMERAQGISLESLMNITEANAMIEALEKAKMDGGSDFLGALQGEIATWQIQSSMQEGSPVQAILEKYPHDTDGALKALRNFKKRVEERTPFAGNLDLTPDNLRNLIAEYQQVLVEQFNKIDAGGKVIHGDIHPGNIFVDYDALISMKTPNQFQKFMSNLFGFKTKMKNHDVFTLIDTGNIIELNAEQSMSLLKLSSYIDNGNYKKIAEYVMQGVEGEALGGRTKEKATKIISDELKKCFTDKDIALDVMTNDNMLKLTSGIMRKNGIVPNETQLNLNKAIQSANNSYDSLINGLMQGRFGEAKVFQNWMGFGDGAKDGNFVKQIKKQLEKEQERDNLRRLPAAQRQELKNLDGNLKPDSKEYYIYKYKQELYQLPDDIKTKRLVHNLRRTHKSFGEKVSYKAKESFINGLKELETLLQDDAYKALDEATQEDIGKLINSCSEKGFDYDHEFTKVLSSIKNCINS